VAVACFIRRHKEPGEPVHSMRGFHPPKKATVTAWYRAAVKLIEDAPDWRTVDMGKAVIDADTIIFHGDGLFISRKRNLR
jgi:hypothetical protein